MPDVTDANVIGCQSFLYGRDLEKLIVLQLVKKFHAFYGTQWFRPCLQEPASGHCPQLGCSIQFSPSQREGLEYDSLHRIERRLILGTSGLQS
jgi:hypothetical protein